MTNEEKIKELIKDYALFDVCLTVYGEAPAELREKYAAGVPAHLKADND